MASQDRYRLTASPLTSLLVIFVFSWVDVSPRLIAQIASDSSVELMNAVSRLNFQLGSGSSADQWRRFLHMNRLHAQAAKGERADIQTLIELHRLISSVPESAAYQPLDDVRIAIENQIRTLNAISNQSPQTLLTEAINRFQPISINSMDFHRNVATFEVQQLKKVYQIELNPERKQLAFETIPFDEILSVLSRIEFELAPEVSEGKMNSLINELRVELRTVVEAIDALPFDDDPTPQPEDNDRGKQDEELQPRVQDDRAQLEARERALNERIRELAAQRDEIRRADLPRKRRRAENLRELYRFEDLMKKAEKDFGDPYFLSAQTALERFTRAFLYGTEDNLQEEFIKRVERLREDLPRLSDRLDRRAYALVGNTLEWMEHTMQVPELVSAIRAQYSLPNAYLHVSGDFLNRLGSRPVNETRPICEEIKGRQVKGQVRTSGTVSFDLVDDPDQVHVSIRSLNNIVSDTYIEQGPLKIFIQTNGQAEARRSLAVGLGGLFDEASYGAANMDNRFCGTSSNCNIVNRIAEKKFWEEKRDSDVRTASRARKELLQRFEKETKQAVDQGRNSLTDARQRSFDRVSQLPQLYLTSASNNINAVAHRSSKWNLAAPDYPQSSPVKNDIDIRIHDSLLSNYAEPMFRGKTFSNEELAELLKELFDSEENLIAPNEQDDQQDSFTITFSNVRPVQFELDNDQIRVVISAVRFSQERRSINAGLTITMTFQVISENGKLFLVRVGPADLDYIEGQEKSAELVGFRSMLSGKLNPQDRDDEIKVELPDNLLPIDKIDALKDRPEVRKLLLSQFRIQSGWLYVGWNHHTDSSPTRPVDTPSVLARVRTRFTDSPTTPRVAENFRD